MVESVITVVLEVVKCLAPPTERQINYLRNYTSNIDNLRKEIKKMTDDRESMQHAVVEAERNGEVIEKNVQEWLGSVNNAIVEAEKFASNEARAKKWCFMGLCPNLKARLRYSKEAVKRSEGVSKLQQDRRFDRISYRSSPEDVRLMSSKDYEVFESRMSILKNILAALKNPDVNLLGIYGMGGIGKTMLAKEVARQAESDQLFDQVVFAEVSQRQDIKTIQGEIADKLGVNLEGETESGRARNLYDRLKKEKKILLILDNIWEKLDLQTVGIPHGDHHKGCKILLTARSQETLSAEMDCQQNFQIGILDDEEAWRLFKKMAGDYIESSQYKTVATDVMKQCAGLPISIVTVARALRNKTTAEWKDALQQLRRPSSSTNYKRVQKDAYSAVELSYNHLESEELKKVFLLIGYTYMERINLLLMYGMGLDLFEGINLMTEARDRVQTLVNKLKASCMLLDHTNEQEDGFSMHDVVRDVAISIASTNGELYNQWKSSDEAVKFYTSMVLRDVKTDDVLSEVLECPQLKLLSISGSDISSSISIPDDFFMKIISVRVLALNDMNISSLPSSLGLLTNLQTLCFNWCEMKDIAIVGELKRLEIILLRGHIKQLPKELDQLTRLRLLDLSECWSLKVIPPNVLAKLSHLEELYIYNFEKWEVEVDGLKNVSPDELKHLSNLTSLELYIKDVNILPKGLFFEKLERYDIRIGVRSIKLPSEYSRIFQLELNSNIRFKDGMMVQLKGVEKLVLHGLQEQDINYFASELLKGGSLQLKYLQLLYCDAPNTGDLKDQRSVLPNLEYLRVEAKQLPLIFHSTEDFFYKLKYFDVDLDESSIISPLHNFFPKFQTVQFFHIFGERGWSESYELMVPAPAVIIRKVNKFGDIKQILKPSAFLHNLKILCIYGLNRNDLNNLMPSSNTFHNLITLDVWGCIGFMKFFTSSTAKSLVQLRRMKIDFCYTIMEIIADDDDGDSEANDEIVFRQLKELFLISLRELSTPMLQKVELDELDEDKWTWEGDLNTTIQQQYLKTTKEEHEEITEESDEETDEEDTEESDDEETDEEDTEESGEEIDGEDNDKTNEDEEITEESNEEIDEEDGKESQ